MSEASISHAHSRHRV